MNQDGTNMGANL